MRKQRDSNPQPVLPSTGFQDRTTTNYHMLPNMYYAIYSAYPNPFPIPPSLLPSSSSGLGKPAVIVVAWGGIRTHDLQLMRLASYHCYTPQFSIDLRLYAGLSDLTALLWNYPMVCHLSTGLRFWGFPYVLPPASQVQGLWFIAGITALFWATTRNRTKIRWLQISHNNRYTIEALWAGYRGLEPLEKYRRDNPAP